MARDPWRRWRDVDGAVAWYAVVGDLLVVWLVLTIAAVAVWVGVRR